MKTNNAKIRYSRKWFNPAFFIIEDAIKEIPELRRVLIYGGKSSSKTISICQYLAKSGIERGESSILFRKESARVKTTIKKSFELAIKTTRLQNAWKKYDRMFKCINGAEAILTGLDDDEKAKGVEGYSYLLFDELNQFDKSEWDQANLSLRGFGRNILFATWNPVSKKSWVKTKLQDTYVWKKTKYKLPSEDSFVKLSEDKTTLLIKTNYKDNYWVVGSPDGTYGYRDENLIQEYEALKLKNYNLYKINVLGNYGNTQKGGEFYKEFDANKHLCDKKYDPELPLHISFDENVNPYVSLSIYQAKGDSAWKIDEITLKYPRNTLKDTMQKFVKRYGKTNLPIYVYGDRTSLKSDSKLERGVNFFTLVTNKYLNGYRTVLRLPRQNPSVYLRGMFINDILAGELPISYCINSKCENTIEDYENVKEASDGTKQKNKVKDKATGITYEEYGHLTDTDDYFLCEYFKDQFKSYQKKSKKFAFR